jgi:aspartyl-tRNA(Asn)/glutamyl-tRNA(Gln) amidotransferase subunit C
MAITRAEVVKIAGLAKLDFSDAELDALIPQFQDILEYVEKLKQVDISGIEPTSHVALTEDFERYIFREDAVGESLPAEEALANAPDQGRDHFRVPNVMKA